MYLYISTFHLGTPSYESHLYSPYQTLHFRTTPTPRPLLNIRTIVEWVTAQRTSTLVTARKPLEQAAAVEEMLARLAALVRHLLVAGHDTVADSTFGLALQCTGDIAAEG